MSGYFGTPIGQPDSGNLGANVIFTPASEFSNFTVNGTLKIPFCGSDEPKLTPHNKNESFTNDTDKPVDHIITVPPGASVHININYKPNEYDY